MFGRAMTVSIVGPTRHLGLTVADHLAQPVQDRSSVAASGPRAERYNATAAEPWNARADLPIGTEGARLTTLTSVCTSPASLRADGPSRQTPGS
jgi:hypothetical protein